MEPTKRRHKAPRFDDVWPLDKVSAEDCPELFEALLSHGVVFIHLPEEDSIIKCSEKTEALMYALFQMTQEEKSIFSSGQPVGDAGYQLRKDLKEQYQVRYGLGVHNPESLSFERFSEKFNKFERFARRLLKPLFGENFSSINELLDPPAAERDESYTTSSVLTLNHYFNDENCPQYACPAHVDAGFISLALLPSKGLQFRNPTTENWVDVSDIGGGARPNLVIFGGEALAQALGLPHLAMMHRVIKTESARQSMIFKLRPRPELVGPRGDADYGVSVAHFKWFESKKAAPAGFESDSPPRSADDLSIRLLIDIFRFLPSGIDLSRCSQVCTRWRAASANRQLWRFFAIAEHHAIGTGALVDWKKLYKERHLHVADPSPKKTEERQEKKQQQKPAPSLERPTLPDSLLQEIRDSELAICSPLKREFGMLNVKLTAVGTGSVGKTCSMLSFATNSFPEEYVPTVFDEYSANVMVDGIPYSMGLWDTAGQEEYDRLRPLSYPSTNCFLLMFSVSSRTSLTLAEEKFIPELRQHCPNVPILLIGTKVDLYFVKNPPEDMVTADEGRAMAEKHGLVGYMQISALLGVGLKEMFYAAIRIGVKYGGADPNQPAGAKVPKRKCAIQ